MLDALIDLCRRAQTADLLPESHGATPRVTVTVSYEDLVRQSGYGTTETSRRATLRSSVASSRFASSSSTWTPRARRSA